MKKILSLILALTLVFSLFSMCGLTASAASYPVVYLDNSGVAYIGDTVPLNFTYMPAYNYEKMTVNIYDPDGDYIASSEFEFRNQYSNYVSFTSTWDTTGKKPGKYTVEVVKEFYSFYRWNTTPTNYTSSIVLKKPIDKKAINNPFKGSKENYKVSQDETIAATKSGINNTYNAWKNLYVKNVANPYNIQLTEIVMGSKAREIAVSENRYNYISEYDTTCQWVLMKFKVKNRGKSDIKFSDLISWHAAYLSDGKEATQIDNCTFGDLPNYSTVIAPGETKEAWVGFLMLKSQGLPFLKLQNNAYINVNPLCATKHKYSDNSDKNCNLCNQKRLVVSSCKLSTTTYTYNGKVKTPNVTVKNSAGKTLKKNTDYTVKYATGRKNPGKYKVTITFKGNYTGTKTLYFTINPAKTKVLKITPAKKSLKVYVSKKSTQVSGYQIQYATNKSFKSAKTKNLTSYKTTSVTLKGLSAKKTYFVRVRTYKTVSGKKYYSGWSSIAYKKTK